MRVLGVGEDHALGDLYLDLIRDGHQVRVDVACAESHRVMAGLVPRCEDWRRELDWIRAAGEDGLIVFETACHGDWQDQLRRDGFQVIGGSAWGDRLENERDFGQKVLREAGLQTAAMHAFSDFEAAVDFVQRHPARYVFKFCDSHAPSSRNYVSQLASGADLVGVLRLEARRSAGATPPGFVLMDHLSGIEVGVGAYFDGQKFLSPACLDWEHKNFFPDDLGELTGEMGTVVTYRGAGPLFDQTLSRLEPSLRASGYCGYINLNTIINQKGVWPLELTCRFGYPGYSICAALHRDSWADVFRRMLRQRSGPIDTQPGFSVGVVLTVPPFPQLDIDAADRPVYFREVLSEEEHRHLHFAEIASIDRRLFVSGCQGYAMVVTGVGMELGVARANAYRLARKLVIPQLRYRNDIGARLEGRELDRLAALGYWDPGVSTLR